MSDDMNDDLAQVRDAIGRAISDDNGAVMVTGFAAVVKAIEPDGRTTVTTISDNELTADTIGLLMFGVEAAKQRIWREES